MSLEKYKNVKELSSDDSDEENSDEKILKKKTQYIDLFLDKIKKNRKCLQLGARKLFSPKYEEIFIWKKIRNFFRVDFFDFRALQFPP